MAKQLKQILLNIAQLSNTDQRWILRKLPHAQLTTLKQNQGLTLLKEAQRFKTLNLHHQNKALTAPETKQTSKLLPDYCQELATKSPLYSAIILDQGNVAWQSVFLEQYDEQGFIKNALEQQVPDLKPLVKEAVFEEWEKNYSFAAYLEAEHG